MKILTKTVFIAAVSIATCNSVYAGEAFGVGFVASGKYGAGISIEGGDHRANGWGLMESLKIVGASASGNRLPTAAIGMAVGVSRDISANVRVLGGVGVAAGTLGIVPGVRDYGANGSLGLMLHYKRVYLAGQYDTFFQGATVSIGGML